jgi:hypothetical protein
MASTGRMLTILALALSGILLAASPRISAQSNDVSQSTEEANRPPPEPIVTDRPTDSASPLLVPRGSFQLEVGYKFSRFVDDVGSTDVQVLPDLLARYGITGKVEARLAAAGWTVQNGVDDKPSGFADISLGTKVFLADERGARPQMGLLVDVSLPVGHSEHTSSYVIPRVLFLGGNTLSDRIGLTYNIGPSIVTFETEGESDTSVDLGYAVALSGSIGGPFTLFGEFYGAFTFGSLPDRHNFQVGSTILLTRLFQLDVRGGLGLVDDEPSWLVGAGLAFRVPR